MPTGRIVVVSQDRAVGQQLATALQPVVDNVESYDSIAAVPAGVPVIAVLPKPDLAAAVALMQASERVVGFVVADDHAPHHISAMATRIVADDLFGLHKVL